MKSYTWLRIRELLTTAGLAALLLIPLPASAAARKSKATAKNDTLGAVCTTGGCSSTGDQLASAGGDRKLGTAVTWMESPDAASHAASDEGKLVFMIQVSGNFARQEFT